MRKWFTRLFVLTLVLFMAAGQSAAFDLKIGYLDFGPSPTDTPGPRPISDATVGAMITIPFGAKSSGHSTASLNGQDISRFTQQNAKDTFIVIFLVGTLVAVGMLTAGATANAISSE